MKPGSHPVKIREKDEQGKVVSKQVGVAEFPIFDSTAEAIEQFGEEKTLELINAQTRTNELNRVRSLHRPGGISKTFLRNKALASISAEEFMSVAGDPDGIEKLIAKKAEEIRLQMVESGQLEDDSED